MTRIVNLTPHAINLIVEGEPRVEFGLTPAGSIARVDVERIATDPLPLNGREIITHVSRLGAPVDLPEPQQGTIYIVSQMVAQACPARRDLYFPDSLLRDDAGRVVGCAALGQVPEPSAAGAPPIPTDHAGHTSVVCPCGAIFNCRGDGEHLRQMWSQADPTPQQPCWHQHGADEIDRRFETQRSNA